MRFLSIGLWLVLAMGTRLHAATVVIVIVSSERSPAYVEAAEVLVSALVRRGLSRDEVLQLTGPEFAATGPLTPKLFVALGTSAAQVLAQSAPRAPVLSALLPRSSFERVLLSSGRKASAQFSALYLDQPFSRQLELIRLALPTASQVGVVWGPESRVQAPALKAAAQASGLALVEAEAGVGASLFPVLKDVLQDANVLLAVADPQVYNSSSIQNILLSSIRMKVPLMAFSPAYVRAGALMALYATPTQIGVQAAAMAHEVLHGNTLPATPIYADDFSVDVNELVTRSLGLSLNAAALRERLRRSKGAP